MWTTLNKLLSKSGLRMELLWSTKPNVNLGLFKSDNICQQKIKGITRPSWKYH